MTGEVADEDVADPLVGGERGDVFYIETGAGEVIGVEGADEGGGSDGVLIEEPDRFGVVTRREDSGVVGIGFG